MTVTIYRLCVDGDMENTSFALWSFLFSIP